MAAEYSLIESVALLQKQGQDRGIFPAIVRLVIRGTLGDLAEAFLSVQRNSVHVRWSDLEKHLLD